MSSTKTGRCQVWEPVHVYRNYVSRGLRFPSLSNFVNLVALRRMTRGTRTEPSTAFKSFDIFPTKDINIAWTLHLPSLQVFPHGDPIFFSQKFGILAKEKLRCGCRRGWRFGSGIMKLISNQLNVTCVQDGHFEHPWPWCRRGPCWFLARCRGAVLAAGLFGNSPLDVEIWLRHWFVFSEKLSLDLDCRFAVIWASFTEGGILESIPVTMTWCQNLPMVGAAGVLVLPRRPERSGSWIAATTTGYTSRWFNMYV